MIERGDVNSWVSGNIWTQLPATRPGWTRDGFLRPFSDLSPPGFSLGHNGERNFHCPNFHDTYLENDEERALWLAMRSYVTFGRNIIGPPGMPAELTQALRDALTAAMADRRFADGLETAVGVRNTFIDGASAQRLVTDVVDNFEANRTEIERIQAGRIRQVRPLGLAARLARVAIGAWKKPSLGPVLTPSRSAA